MSINAAEATQVAADYYKAISTDMVQLSVEEIDKDSTENVWLITLGIAERNFSISSGRNKEYKLFKIDMDNSEVHSMKIRKV